MIGVHPSDSIILFSDEKADATIGRTGETTMQHREHVISVVLNNEDWKAFLQVQPEPVTWLKERIRETIAASRPQAQGKDQTPTSAA
jgi:hypothetical protein